MTRARHSRLLAPAVIAVAGSVLAGAVAIGHSWRDAVVTEVVALLLCIGFYFLTRSDSDVGSVYGRRADERQQQVRSRATRSAFFVMIGVSFLCVVILVALGKSYWQADLIGSLGGGAYLLTMMIYGAHDVDRASAPHGVMASGVSPDHERSLDESEND